MTRGRVAAIAVLALGFGISWAEQPPLTAAREDAYRANNLGVALLEQYSYDEAVRSFRRALERDPGLNIARVNVAIGLFYAGAEDDAVREAAAAIERLPQAPQAHYIAGLAARAGNRLDEAARAFERVLQLDSSDAGSRVHLGQILLQQRQYTGAITRFREALAAEPFNVTAAYGLATALTRSGNTEEAGEAQKRFELLRDSAYGITYSRQYLEEGRYGEAVASTGAEPELIDRNPPAVTFADSTAAMIPSQQAGDRGGPAPSVGGSVTLFDADGDGDLDLFATSPASGQRFYLNNEGVLSESAARAGLAAEPSGAAVAAVSADYDNDGRPDLLLLHARGHRLLHQRQDGTFEDVTRQAGISGPPDARSAAFADVDHDGDLDIFLAGRRMLRNNGNATFTDITAASGVADGGAAVLATAPTDFDNRRDVDLLTVERGQSPNLFQNMRDGSFRDVAADAGLPSAAAYTALAAADVNKDGYTDFFFARADAAGVLALSDGHGRFKTAPAAEPTAGATNAQFVDYDNDGLVDLFTVTGRQPRLFRNAGQAWTDVTEPAKLGAEAAGLPADVQSIGFGDVDRDGDLDAVLLLADGSLRTWRNAGGSAHRSLLVRLSGRVSNRGGIGSKVDIRAGSLRQRIESSAATPAVGPADILFGLGSRPAADVVRVIWPSGTLQAETLSDLRSPIITELDRKPSSCPYLYVWNGSRFDFVTDFMGGGEIGYWHAPGVWNTPDPDEYVRIPDGALQVRDGRYELRVTNELEEALFVDRLQLVAVDHDRNLQVFPKEGLGAPPATGLTLVAGKNARAPAAAMDEHGHDVLPRLESLDRVYPDDFRLIDIRGYAEPHELTLDLGGMAQGAVLLATGWTDYAFSSDNVAAHQRGLKLTPPSVEVRSASGSWRLLMPNAGIPVGRPQTVVIDLRGLLRPGEHVVRLVTNMRIYWDRIVVDVPQEQPALRVTRVDPAVAHLRWRGFSAPLRSDGREPLRYDYERVSPVSIWKTMVGRYTREGDVGGLVRDVDDMFVIARPGDEIALSFDEASFPPLAQGKRRTLLLYADGFSKEMDISSASPHAVEPLPFHAMRSYPYGPRERYPSTTAHREYQARYNTRVVSRPLPPIETAIKEAGGRK